MTETFPLGSLESLVMQIAVRDKVPPNFMPRTCALLLDQGLIDAEGEATQAGRAIWSAHAAAKNRAALRFNLLPSVSDAAQAALRRLASGLPLLSEDYPALRRHEPSLARWKDGDLTITPLGAEVVELIKE